MATPFFCGEAIPRAPITSVTASAATWRGTSLSRRAFATLPNETFRGPGNGRFSLLSGQGPRLGFTQGSIATVFRRGTGAATVVLVQSSYSSVAAPLITLGVNAEGHAVGSIQDIAGTTVAAWTASRVSAVPERGVMHLQLTWDSSTPVDGESHVWVDVNGVQMIEEDFTTLPVDPWSPFRPLYITTGVYCEAGFDGEMFLTQGTAKAPVRSSVRPQRVALNPSTLGMPATALTGTITPVVSMVGSLTLPSLQLTGTITPVVSMVGSLTLPSLQLTGTVAVQTSAVSAWLRLANGTVAGSGYSSVPDLLAANPAVQGTDGRRPAAATSNNGFPIADFDGVADFLSWPTAANNNTSPTGGFGLWIRFDQVNDGTKGIVGCLPGATNRVELIKDNANFVVNVFFSQFVARRGTATAAFLANTWYFITWEFDGTQATDATKCILTINGVVQSLTFVDDGGTPGAMPSTLVSSLGPYAIGARRASDVLGPLDGKIGPNLYVFGTKMSGATQGLLTTASRTALMNFEAPT